MSRNAIVFTANTMHVAQANLMIDTLFDPAKGNFKGDLWVISTHLSPRCQKFLESRGIQFLINPLASFQNWKYREEIARAQPEFKDGRLSVDEAFLLYRNKRMSKLIICDWVEKFGDRYDSIALCDNDLYFQKDVNELFEKTADIDSNVVWYWQEEHENLPGTNLWVKNFHYTRLHDTDGIDFGKHEINIGFVISSPELMRDVFRRVEQLFSSCNIELFRDCRWHDQDLVRLIRGQTPHLFRLFEDGDVLHLCNGGEALIDERGSQQFYHKRTDEKPYIIHFAGGAWKPFNSISASYKVHDEVFFFMAESDDDFDKVRRNTDYDPFDDLSPFFTTHNQSTKAHARSKWQKERMTSQKKGLLLFSWLNTGSHKPVQSMLSEFLSGQEFDLAVIDGNVTGIDHKDLVAEDLPDLLSRVTQTVRNDQFGRFFGYKRHDVPEDAISGAIAALVKEYKCSQRNARAVANAAYLYLSRALAFYRPDVVVCWGSYLLCSRILRKICEASGLPFVTMELGVLPETLAFDCLGHMGESWVARDMEAFKALPLDPFDRDKAAAYLSEVKERLPSRNIQVEVPESSQRVLDDLKAGSKKIVVYIGSNCAFSGHVPYDDRGRTYHSPFFQDNDEVVRHLSEAFADDPDVELLYKPHPITATRGLDLTRDYPNVTVLRDVNLSDCIGIADLAVVKVSQGCYEALLRDKPVLMLGKNQINGSGAVYELEDASDLHGGIHRALSGGLTQAQQAAFEDHVARLLKYYLFSVSGAAGAQPQERLASTLLSLLDKTGPDYLVAEQGALGSARSGQDAALVPTVSIIMPVYNGEDYLVDCIGSLLSQTRGDFELLCVNNGSSDGSQEIIDYFVKLDPRVRGLYQEEPNQRLARNLGVQHARGKYIHFFDCDDLFVPVAYEELLPQMEETGADVLYFFFDELYNSQRTTQPRHRSFAPYLPSEALFQMTDEHKILFSQYPFPWAKIFRADFFREKKLYFDLDCANFDDNPQNLRTLLSSENIYVVNKSYYKFRINDKSMTQSVNPRVYGMLDAIRIMNEIYVQFGKYSEFQKYYVPYKLHLLHFAWTRLPEDLKGSYWQQIPSMYLPGDQEYFERDELFSMFSYLTREKVEFSRSALRGDSFPAMAQKIEPEPKSNEDMDIVALYPNPVEERIVKKISGYLVKNNPKLFQIGKRVYRRLRPLPR